RECRAHFVSRNAGCRAEFAVAKISPLPGFRTCDRDRCQSCHALASGATAGRRGGDERHPSRVPRRLFRCRGRDILVLHLARGPAIAGTGELRRVVKPGGTIRLLEYVWPRGTIRRAITKLWEPWIAWLWSSIRSKPA